MTTLAPMSIAEDYYWQMAARGRLILGKQDGHLQFLCTFFLLPGEKSVMRYYCKLPYQVLDDRKDGWVVYIDHLVSYIPFTRAILRQIEQEVAMRHPQFTHAIWYRARSGQLRDMRYTYRRRVAHAET